MEGFAAFFQALHDFAFQQAVDDWHKRVWAWWQEERAKGFTDEQLHERFWGKELLEKWRKL